MWEQFELYKPVTSKSKSPTLPVECVRVLEVSNTFPQAKH